MKSVAAGAVRDAAASLPVRGAWIEMSSAGGAIMDGVGRSPCGERGLKWTTPTLTPER